MNEPFGSSEQLEGCQKNIPGPWYARFEHGRFVIFIKPEIGIGEKALAITAGSYPVHEANAKLIAAAPDLLRALQWAVENPDDDAYWIGQARVAIAKATGMTANGRA